MSDRPVVPPSAGLLKRIYRTLPVSWRAHPLLHRVKELVQRRLFPHDWIYDEDYYTAGSRQTARESAPHIAEAITRDLGPASVIDVGCGAGDLLAELHQRGCRVLGLERSEAALRVCRARGLPVLECDLESEVSIVADRFDVVASLEVAEHLPEECASGYVELLCSLAPSIVLTAAGPGQGGTDHVNEQPPEYWRAKMAEKDFELDEELSNRWRSTWQAAGAVAHWYSRNLMVFRARDANQAR